MLTSPAAQAPAASSGTRSGSQAGPKWTPVGWGGGGFYYSAAYHPTRNGVLFMGMDVSGVAKSSDGGKSFRIVNTGLQNYAVYSLAVDSKNPDIVYAGTEGGLHKSTDGGESWTLIRNTDKTALRITSERAVSVRSVASDPTESSTVYAASPGGMLYKSTDTAATWRQVFPRSAAAKAASSGLPVQFGKSNRAYSGGLWLPLTPQPQIEGASGIGLALRAEGAVPEQAYITLRTAAGYAYRSRNVRDMFSASGSADFVLRAADFAVDPTFAKNSPERASAAPPTPDWGTLSRIDIARVSNPDQASGLLLSRIFFVATGANGVQVQHTLRDFSSDRSVQTYGNVSLDAAAGSTRSASSVVVCTPRPARVMAATSDGVLVSDDRGETWRSVPSPAKAMHVSCDPGNADVMYGAFGLAGLHKTSDGGATWTKLDLPLSGKFAMREVAVNPKDSKEIFAIGADGWTGVFLFSNDAGASWTMSRRVQTHVSVNPTMPEDSRTPGLSTPTNLTVNPFNPKELFISANWRPAFSADGGRTWEERVRGADITVQTDIRFSDGRTYVSAMDEGIFASDDEGGTWRQLWPMKYDGELSGHVWRLAVSKINGIDRLIATVSPWTGRNKVVVAISEDGGKTFKTTTSGLPTTEIKANTMWGRGNPRALAMDPSNPKIVYLGIDGDADASNPGGGIFRSVDGGYTWDRLRNQPASRRMYYGLAVDPTNPQRLVWGAGGKNEGVYISEDGGESWRNTLNQDGWVFNVHVTADGTMYAGNDNLWRSTDHGKTWTRLTRLSKRHVLGIEVDPRDARTIWITAISWGNNAAGEVYKSTDGGASWIDFTGNLSYRNAQILRFNSGSNELWVGQNILQKVRQ